MFGMEVHWDNRLSLIPHSYGNFVAMATTVKLINSFVLRHIELVVATEVPWSDTHQLHSLPL